MKIGIAAENRPAEKRVVIQPGELKRIAAKHEVLVEQGAGMGVGILDFEYEDIGAKIVPTKEVYACDLVVRIKEPSVAELELMSSGSIIMSMFHLRCRPDLEEVIKRKKLIAIPLENIKNSVGERQVEAVIDSGIIGMDYGFKLWGKNPLKCQVKIMGYGNMARGAIKAAARKLAKVEVLNKANFNEMPKHLPGTDILVDAVNRPFRREVAKEPPFVTRKMLKLLKKGSVLVDLVSNPENHAPIETMRPTNLAKPYYLLDGIYHTSLWGWPGMEPLRISRRYSKQVAPFIKEIADKELADVSTPVKNAVVDFSAN